MTSFRGRSPSGIRHSPSGDDDHGNKWVRTDWQNGQPGFVCIKVGSTRMQNLCKDSRVPQS